MGPDLAPDATLYWTASINLLDRVNQIVEEFLIIIAHFAAER